MQNTIKWLNYIIIPGFLSTIGTGIWLAFSGKPYAIALFTIHKILGIATAALLLFALQKLHSAPVTPILMLIFIIAAIVLVGTGAAMSILKMPPLILRSIHISATIVMLLSVAHM
ncbi:hypothetical protein KHM83_06675 [Fusibacter paucivorans]|uniref:DUF4405 domain-containing protein n=1 Tax=Fusibacter paucivorans TaxID=76009 RepID=A0ABS5PMG9_9FIRM|nr:hypothetical protein [Fusibacter paucivorans]MBS7526355.1 hypothetical protein [Fusibacter paucivorans]